VRKLPPPSHEVCSISFTCRTHIPPGWFMQPSNHVLLFVHTSHRVGSCNRPITCFRSYTHPTRLVHATVQSRPSVRTHIAPGWFMQPSNHVLPFVHTSHRVGSCNRPITSSPFVRPFLESSTTICIRMTKCARPQNCWKLFSLLLVWKNLLEAHCCH
jgi:hypothetical protein